MLQLAENLPSSVKEELSSNPSVISEDFPQSSSLYNFCRGLWDQRPGCPYISAHKQVPAPGTHLVTAAPFQKSDSPPGFFVVAQCLFSSLPSCHVFRWNEAFMPGRPVPRFLGRFHSPWVKFHLQQCFIALGNWKQEKQTTFISHCLVAFQE